MEIKKIDFRNSKTAKKIPKKNHSIIGVLEIPNPKYLGKIKKSVILNTPNDSHFRLNQLVILTCGCCDSKKKNNNKI